MIAVIAPSPCPTPGYPDDIRMWRYALGVGGNRGEVPATLERAERLLVAAGAPVVARGPLLTTAAVGGPAGQGDFRNTAWLVETGLGPHALLALCQAVETACGRVRTTRWGPRTLDLDLLLRDDGLRVSSRVLELPHPLLLRRSFALEPLAAIAAGWPVPGHGTVAACRDALDASGG